MKDKINIAELIKECPKGMEFDCTICNNAVTLEAVDTEEYFPIRVVSKAGFHHALTREGCIYEEEDAKCVIFPKGKTTWEGFQRPFKDGDVIFTHANCLKVGLGNTWISIYQENRNGGVATYVDYAEDGSDYYSNIDGDKAFLCMENDILRQRLATEEEKAKLFKAIKDNGYKWNEETKTLEELVPDKFDITSLKPFDKVLVRDNDGQRWTTDMFSFYSGEDIYPYICVGHYVNQCIPYDQNKHLLGNTDDCDEYFKTWK